MQSFVKSAGNHFVHSYRVCISVSISARVSIMVRVMVKVRARGRVVVPSWQ